MTLWDQMLSLTSSTWVRPRVVIARNVEWAPCIHQSLYCAAEISIAVCHESKVGLLLKQASSATVLKTIITMGTTVSQEDKDLAAECGITIYTFKEIEVGRECC